MAAKELGADELAWRCDPAAFGFHGTDGIEPPDGPLGQERAAEALELSLSLRRRDFNVFVLGPPGSGRHTTVERLLRARAAAMPVPDDWVYVADFADPRRPRAIRLPAGRGRALRRDLHELLGDLLAALRNAFESEDFRTRRQMVEQELEERQKRAVAEVEEEARRQGIALLRTPVGFVFAPTVQGRVMPPEQFQQLPEPLRHQIEQRIERLQERLQQALSQMPAWIKETHERIRRLVDETARAVVDWLVARLSERWRDQPAVVEHLEALRRDVIDHVEVFLALPEQVRPAAPGSEEMHPLFRRYAVNLFVDNADLAHAPVVWEDDPTYEHLVGRIEHRAEMGALFTDFLLVRAGALHRANGGFLVLDAAEVLARPFAWDALKRTLAAGRVRIEPALAGLGLPVTVALEPEPVPVDVRVVLVGERLLYYLLAELDPEFRRLFKVAADFDEALPRRDGTLRLYAGFAAGLVRREGLLHLEAGALARLLEEAVRLAGDRTKVSTDLETLADIVREADHLARRNGRARITSGDVEAAVAARERRASRLRERALEMTLRDVVHIPTSGRAVGQINGLSVIELGGYAFGRPSRITARARMGAGQVVDIEREVKLGGPIHSKGVLILAGHLLARYALDVPLSLSATLVFEQSYGPVEGDSASAAELLALLSAISGAPLAQNLAITGSVDQHGRIQAIGGVNEKIEGFFELCAARGLDGSHGVVIPASNVEHLQLREPVCRAVAEGGFHVWAVGHVDEAIPLFFGMPAGERGADGRFPEGTLHRLVEDRLRSFAEARRSFAAEGKEEGAARREEEA